MKLEIHTEATILASLAPAWTRLLAQSPRATIFSTPEWADTWWRSFGQQRELLILTLRDGADVVGIAPFFIERSGERRLVRFMGGVDVTDYEDVIAQPGKESMLWEAVLEYLGPQPWELDLHNVPGASPTIEILRQKGPASGYCVAIEREDVCPVIDPLPPSWDAYVDSLDKRSRHELRRKRRRLTGDSDLEIEITWHAPDLPKAMEDFIRLHKLSSADKSEFMTPQMSGYFGDLAQMCQQHGWLSLAFLAVSGKRVSSIMSFEYGDTFYLYNSGYDPDFEHLSAGVMLKALAVDYAITSGKRCYDFLQGSEPYKYDLGGKDTEVYQITCVRS